MPSMEYCMFENTTLEMKQIVGAMEDAESFADLELNEYERPAYFELMRLCAKFLGYAREMYMNEEDVDAAEKLKRTIREIKFETDIEI